MCSWHVCTSQLCNTLLACLVTWSGFLRLRNKSFRWQNFTIQTSLITVIDNTGRVPFVLYDIFEFLSETVCSSLACRQLLALNTKMLLPMSLLEVHQPPITGFKFQLATHFLVKLQKKNPLTGSLVLFWTNQLYRASYSFASTDYLIKCALISFQLYSSIGISMCEWHMPEIHRLIEGMVSQRINNGRFYCNMANSIFL